MKNLKLLTGSVVLAGILLTTGCVKNEESDGVKALRTAQASLIEARATVATAEAAFITAETAVEQAKVAIQEAQADATVASTERTRIQNAMDEAQNQHDIEILAMELADAELDFELSQAQLQNSINLLMVTAEKDLAAAQKDLDIALSDYEAELAADAAKNKELDEYLGLYIAKMGEISTQRGLILAQNQDILGAQLEMNYGDVDSEVLSVVALDIAQKESELAIMNSWKTAYVAATNNPDNMANQVIAAEADLEEIRTDIDSKELEILAAAKVRDDAMVALSAANDEVADALADYNDAKADEATISTFTTGLSTLNTIPGEYLKVILDEPNAGDADYYSLEHYDDAIDNETDPDIIADYNADRAVVVAYINTLQAEYGGNVADEIDDLATVYFQKTEARDTAQDAFDAADDALTALNNEKALLDLDEIYAENYLNAIEADYDTLVDNLYDINVDIEDIEQEIATLNNDVSSWNDYIVVLEQELEVMENKLDALLAQAADYKDLVDIELGEE